MKNKLKLIVASIVFATTANANANNIPALDNLKPLYLTSQKSTMEVEKINRDRVISTINKDKLEEILNKLDEIANLPKNVGRISNFGSDSNMLMMQTTTGETVYFDNNVEDFIVKGSQFTNLGNLLVSVDEIIKIKNNKAMFDNLILPNKEHYAHFKTKDENKEVKAEVFVLADYTCPYCKALFSNVDTLNRLGVDVYFVPFLNGGLADKNSVKITRKILCSENKEEETIAAINDPKGFLSKINESELNCPASFNVLKILNNSHSFDIEGTPTSILPNGHLFSGYSSIVDFVKDIAIGKFKGDAINNMNGEEK